MKNKTKNTIQSEDFKNHIGKSWKQWQNCFVDIGEIDDRHCLNFLFLK